jgi:repressor LexA
VREIAAAFDLRSPRTVRDYLLTLQRKEYLRLHPGKKRGIEILKGTRPGIPVVGKIAAGTPIVANENVEDILEMNAGFFTAAPCFAVRVRGDSMTGAGIMEGDYVVIRRQSDADNGQIVAALLRDEVTIKRYKKIEDKVVLLPENPAYEPIVSSEDEDPLILGVMVGLLRKL